MTIVLGGTNPAVTFPDGTIQNTAGLPLTGGDVTGGVNLATTSGNVGIGTSSVSAYFGTTTKIYNAGNGATLQLGSTSNNFYIYTSEGSAISGLNTNKPLAFLISDVERMRIDSSGNLLVGTANSSLGKLAVSYVGTSTPAVYVQNTSGASGAKGYLSDIPSASNNTSSYHFAGLTQGIGVFYLYGNGTSSWTSDERKKKNIQTTRDGYLNDLMNLRVVKYNWINQEDNEPKELGLIAQEVEKVFPGLVQDALNADIDGTTYKVFKGSVLPYMLLKAIQEQQALITDLTTRLSALESK